jgi:polyisoprenoid-binding protein YceI
MNKYLTLLVLVSSVAFADPWTINKDHSEVFFTVPYMTVSDLTGRFNEFSGEVDLAGKTLEVKIETASIDTGNKMRDGHLKGSDFFQSPQYPQIIFKSKNVQSIGANKYKAAGEMTVKNITKPFTIEFTSTASVKDTWGYENRFVKFKSKMNRREFNINWNKSLDGEKYLVGDEITFYGTFQIQPLKGKTPNSKHMIPDTKYIREQDLKNQKEDSPLFKKMKDLMFWK